MLTSTIKELIKARKSGLSNGAAVGEIIGLWITGYICDRFGFKKTIGGALIWVTGMIFIFFFAESLGMTIHTMALKDG